MTKDWWFKFEIPAWRNSPELRKCSLETRGFWIDCIAIMRDTGNPTLSGTVQDFARMIGCFPEEVARCINELHRTNTANVTPVTILNANETVNVTLTSRRYKKELTTKEKSNLRVQKHRRNANVTLNVTPKKRLSVKSKKKEVRKEEEIREASPPPEPAPPQEAPQQKKVHPAILAVKTVTGRYPCKQLWDDIIERLGDNVDLDRLRLVHKKWIVVGYNPVNLEGILDWYRDGIPERYTTNGSGNRKAATPRAVDTFAASSEASDKEYVYTPPPPCDICGDEYCLMLHSEERAALWQSQHAVNTGQEATL